MQVIEKMMIHPTRSIYWGGETLPLNVCDEVNFKYTVPQALAYLEGFNRACKAAGKVVAMELYIEHSPDPIGDLTHSPAIGGTIRSDVYLGDVESVFGSLHTRFIGYLDKQKNAVIPVDIYSM